MKLDTKYFGPVEYSATDVLSFPQGLFSFEDERQFLLLPFHGSEGTMLCLQSVKTPALAFVAMNPFALLPSYAPELRPEELEQLGVSKSQDLCYYVLCAVKNPVANSTVNLRCPIALNDESRRAIQVILDTDRYHMRHLLAESGRKGEGPTC